MQNQLKSYRALKGYTQEEMATILKMTRTCYANKEEGKKEFKRSEIKKIIAVFDMSAEDIKEVFFT